MVSAHDMSQGCGKTGQTGREAPGRLEQGGSGRRSAVARLPWRPHQGWAADGDTHLEVVPMATHNSKMPAMV